MRQHHYKENSRSLIKGKVIWRPVRKSSQMGLASPIATFREVVPSTMSMCHSVMAGWAHSEASRTEQVCPLPRAQKSNAPAQFLLGLGVSFPFSSPSTHTRCASSTSPAPRGPGAPRTLMVKGAKLKQEYPRRRRETGPVVHSASCSFWSCGVGFSLCQCGFFVGYILALKMELFEESGLEVSR